MSNQLQVIERTLNSVTVISRMAMTLGANSDEDPVYLQRARLCASSVLAEVQKTAGDAKKDLTLCKPDSIAQCAIDAANFGFMIDSRQHAHLVKYGNIATLQIGYRGYLFKIKEHYPDADFVVEPVYKGDVLKLWSENGIQHYTFQKNSVFRDGAEDFEGVLFAVTYTDHGRLIRKVAAIPKSRIERARKAAKQDYIWSSDYIEKAKAAAIKSACKVLFAAIQGLQEMIRYDNEHNHTLEKPREEVRAGSIVDNINQTLTHQPAPEEESRVVDADFTDDPEPEPVTAGSDWEATEANAKIVAEEIKGYIISATDLIELESIMFTDYKADLGKIKGISTKAHDFLNRAYEAKVHDLGGTI